MGFEDNNDALGFEDDQLDLDGDADLSMGTGSIKAQRKKGIKTEEVAFARPKRDRFGRRGDGEESGEGADMLNPDKPTRIAGGFSRREMTPQEVKPLQRENSKFSYLFSEDEEDEDEVSTVEGKRSAVDALSMKGDEAEAGNIFEREARSVIHSQGKPQRRREESVQSSGTSRFSRRGESSEQTEKPAASRFSRRASAQSDVPAEPVKEEPVIIPEPVVEDTPPVIENSYTEPAAEESYASEQPASEAEAESAVYAESQAYGYGNPYMYGQYPPPYSPYGQPYPPQNPYMQPYGQPYGQPYPPYQYPPAGYAQPQYIPVGYVFQAGFVPVELAHGTPQRRRRPSSAARAAHRYDQAPEAAYEEQQTAREVHRVRAIAAKSEESAENTYVPEPAPEPVSEPIIQSAPEPVIYEEPAAVYETQYDRIVSEIPEEPVQEVVREEKPESTVPSRFARRGSAERSTVNDRPAESAAPSRFSARGSSSRSAGSDVAGENTGTAAPSVGGRFNRRG